MHVNEETKAKRTTSTSRTSEPPFWNSNKRSSRYPAAANERRTSGKIFHTHNHSAPLSNGGGASQWRGQSQNGQNGSTNKSSPDTKGKPVDSPEREQKSKRGNQRNYASSSLTPVNQSANCWSLEECAKLCIRFGEGSKLSPQSTLSNGSQALEQSRASEPELVKADPQEFEPSGASEPELVKADPQGFEPSGASEPELVKADPQGFEPSGASEPELVKADPQGFGSCRASEPELVKADPRGLEPLPRELHDGILGRLPMREVIRLRPELGRYLRNAIYKPAFRENRPSSEGEFSPSFFETDVQGDLHWRGLDTWSRQWTTLPSLNFAKLVLPSPDQDLFKDYLVAGDGGLLCIYVGKSSGCEKLVVCNPLTQQVKVLPPLNHSRHPVLMHIKVDLDSGHYKVFVAGSAAIGTAEVSLKTEEYDSREGGWECPDGSDLPCQPFGLNEYQNGVYVRDSERELLMCVAIINTRGRGVLVYDITKKKWAQSPHVKQLHIPLVNSEPNVSHLATTQIVECGGSVFVFSEQECGRDVYFLIHKLVPDAAGDFTWDEVVRRKRTGGRGLLVYPEFTCVPVSEHELGIFNTIEHTLDIVDLYNPTEVAPFQAAPASKRNRFHSLNPIGFIFKPTFRSVVCPLGRNPKLRCDLNKRGYCSECQRLKAEDL